MPDPTLHADLPWYIKAFFDSQSRLSAGSKKVYAGTYVENSGVNFDEYGVSITPTCVLKVGAQEATTTGSDWSTAGITLTGTGARSEGFVYMQERGDAVADDAETLTRLLSPYNQDGENGAGWATSIAGDGERATRFNKVLEEITTVPSGAPSQDATVLQSFLRAHFTYDGTTRAYYGKWSGSGRSFPDDTSTAYRQKAVVEYKLERDRFYVYSLITSGAPTNGVWQATEAITVLDRDGDDLNLNVVYAATRQERAQLREFTFFQSAAGLGIAAPDSARGTMDGSLVDLVSDTDTAAVLSTARGNHGFSVENEKIVVFGAVTADADFTANPLPEGVQMDSVVTSSEPQQSQSGTAGPDPDPEDSDPWDEPPVGRGRVFLAPPDKIAALAAHSQIEVIEPATTEALFSEVARTNTKQPQMLRDLGVTAGGGGEGVYVGVIDTGIDGTHAAFGSRIHKVWNMSATPNSSHRGPTAYPTQGQVYSTTADIRAHSTDGHGHGTHVSGIAAGESTSTYPHGGMAPKARLLVAAAANASWRFPAQNTYRAIRWMIQEAGDRPLVINLSLGGHGGHGHDGLDRSALDKRDLIRGWLLRNYWMDGKILVAAAGNAGAKNGHIHTATLADGATATWNLRVGQAVTGGQYDIGIWGRPTPASVRGGSFEIRVRRPGTADDTGWVTRDWWSRSRDRWFTGTRVTVSNMAPQPYSQHARGLVRFRPYSWSGGLAPSTWQIMVRNTLGHEMEIHGYSSTALGARGLSPIFFFPNATQESIIGSPAHANGFLAVGSSVNRATYNNMAGTARPTSQPLGFSPTTNQVTGWGSHAVGDRSFSSCMGPVRGSRRTLATVAPGRAVASAASAQAAHNAASQPGATSVVYSGTSMASPVLTGLIACVLEKHPTLDYVDVRRRLARAATVPSGWSRRVWGPGLLDASRLD